MVSKLKLVYSNPMHLDHIVIYVPDLERAMQNYTARGFTVSAGGQHARTENALIIFADGTYLELLALQKNVRRPLIRLAVKLGLIERSAAGKTDMYWRLLRWITRGTGIVDWCVAAPEISATLQGWKTEDRAIIPPQYFDRTRPDGKVAKWYLGAPKTFDLPFLIEDISDRDIRVPPASDDTHPNGATGIAEITLSVPDPQKAQAQYEKIGMLQLGETIVRFKKNTQPHNRIALKINHAGGELRSLAIP